MDKKKILEDGLLEQYLLGELSDEQEVLIQKVLKEDADLRTIFEGLEEEFEKIAFENAILPPDSVKKALYKAIETSGENTKDTPFISLSGVINLANSYNNFERSIRQ